MLLLWLHIQDSTAAPTGCKSPSQKDLQERLDNFKMDCSWGNLTFRVQRFNRGLQRCPNDLPNSPLDSLSQRSTCPWESYTHTDNMRYPRDLEDVRCLCEDCVGSNGQPQCEVIYDKKPVLRIVGNGCTDDGFDNYREGWVEMGRGCICARPRT